MKKINLTKTKANMALLNKRAWLRRKHEEHPDDPVVAPEYLTMFFGGYYPTGGETYQRIVYYLREDGYLVEEDEEAA